MIAFQYTYSALKTYTNFRRCTRSSYSIDLRFQELNRLLRIPIGLVLEMRFAHIKLPLANHITCFAEDLNSFSWKVRDLRFGLFARVSEQDAPNNPVLYIF
jgi:hypothetical protein